VPLEPGQGGAGAAAYCLPAVGLLGRYFFLFSFFLIPERLGSAASRAVSGFSLLGKVDFFYFFYFFSLEYPSDASQGG